ncbi:diguanylate cyclase [Inhella sp.]|uniref:sensor domain-containing diguanylate cyclase n=1 Tax=Inhella sp. TaxID=1921806 RepID=UPI0035AEE04D
MPNAREVHHALRPPQATAGLAPWRRLQWWCLLVALLWLGLGGWVAQALVERNLRAAAASQQLEAEAAARRAAERLAQHLRLYEALGDWLSLRGDLPAALLHAQALRQRHPDWADLDQSARHALLTAEPPLRELSAQLERLQGIAAVQLLYVLDDQGWCVAASRWQTDTDCIGARYADRAYFRQALASGHGQQFSMGRQVRQPFLFFATRVGGRSQLPAATVLRIDVKELALLLPTSGELTAVLDEHGVVLADSGGRHTLQRLPGQTAAIAAERYGVAALQAMPIEALGASQWRYADQTLNGVLLPVPGAALRVLHLQPAAPMELAALAARQRALLALGAGLALLIVAERLLDRRERERARNAQLQALAEQMHRLAHTDALSGAANRRGFLQGVEAELARTLRGGLPLSLLMLDIDHFKRINDRHGHAAGDAAIAELARRCATQLRPYDLLGRLGGEEFAMLLPGADDDTACRVAERVRAQVQAEAVAAPGLAEALHMTVSIGVAAWQAGDDADTLLARADAALYAAKQAGRNRVVRAEPPTIAA